MDTSHINSQRVSKTYDALNGEQDHRVQGDAGTTYFLGRGSAGVRVANGGMTSYTGTDRTTYTNQTPHSNFMTTSPIDSAVYISREGTQIGRNNSSGYTNKNTEFAVVLDRKMEGWMANSSAYSRNNAQTGAFMGGSFGNPPQK
jgi:hypothetical protein